jgi:Holliday junction DNA helicase RuvA
VIALVEGTLLERAEGAAVVMTSSGIAYEVLCSNATLAALGHPAAPGTAGAPVRLFTYLHVREDAMQLFGFAVREEREVFEKLITVSGVGPKVALAVLSAFSPDALAQAVAAEDAAHISSVPGIGKKTAERIILELKDKLGVPEGLAGTGGAAPPAAAEEARSALMALGYTSTEVRLAISEVAEPDMTTEQLVTAALRRLGS